MRLLSSASLIGLLLLLGCQPEGASDNGNDNDKEYEEQDALQQNGGEQEPERDEHEQTDSPAPEAGPIEVLREYAGRISGVGEEHRYLVIRDEEAYEALIERIPEHEITRQADPPPSEDPLLERPEVDWESEMVLAAHRHENMYVGLRIGPIKADDEGNYEVDVQLEPIGDTMRMASLIGVGRYHAVVVPRTDGEVRVEFIEPEEE